MAGIASLVNYLVGVGHTRIAHVTGPPRFIHTHQREAAWRESITAAGLDPALALSGDFTYEGGRRAADQLLGIADRPTAVICANDPTAIGLMTRVQAGRSVPEDLSVGGYHGIEAAATCARRSRPSRPPQRRSAPTQPVSCST